jgi:hypothetical protein
MLYDINGWYYSRFMRKHKEDTVKQVLFHNHTAFECLISYIQKNPSIRKMLGDKSLEFERPGCFICEELALSKKIETLPQSLEWKTDQELNSKFGKDYKKHVLRKKMFENFPGFIVAKLYINRVPPEWRLKFGGRKRFLNVQYTRLAFYSSGANYVNCAHDDNGNPGPITVLPKFSQKAIDFKEGSIAYTFDTGFNKRQFETFLDRCGNPDCKARDMKRRIHRNLKKTEDWYVRTHLWNLQRCTRCQKELYCSAECQEKMWPVHKLVCKRAK